MFYNKAQREVFRQIKLGNYSEPVECNDYSTDVRVYINGIEVHSYGWGMFIEGTCHLTGGHRMNRLLKRQSLSRSAFLKQKLRGEGMTKIMPEDVKKDEDQSMF